MMNHARVKALKGDGKTVSKKARKSGRASGALTPQGTSPMASLLASPSQSATHSRVPSDASDEEEDGDFEFDDMASSVHSVGSGGETTPEESGTSFDVKALIDGLQDRKHHNSEVREQFLQVFIKVMRLRYSAETHAWLDDAAHTLAELFLKDANRSSAASERLLNLKAYCLTVATVEDMDVFEGGYKTLKQVLADDDDEECQVHAIYALCLTVLYGGGGEEAALELMEYLVEMVETDGESVNAHDNVVVVSAALRGWAFVASHVADYSDYADAAMDAFVDQLDSADVEIQSLAGHCIALIYESSRDHESETGQPFQLPYDPQRLAGRLSELAKLSSKTVSRKHRRDLRENLVSVVTSLQRGVGPYYSTALYVPEKDSHVPASHRLDDGTAEYGYRCRLRLGAHSTRIDSWSLYSRVAVIKLIFRAGLQHHVFVNPVVMECLEDADWDESHAAAADHHHHHHEKRPRPSAKARKR